MTATATAAPARSPSGRGELPRLLAHLDRRGSVGLAEHLAVHGPLPQPAHTHLHPRRGARNAAAALIEEVSRSGLLGRGGGAFPTATKMSAVAAAGGRPIVVVNAMEGEPASGKDRLLAAGLPHLLLDGVALAARAVHAGEAIVGVADSSRQARKGLTAALAERERSDDGHLQVSVVALPGGYVAGQESALVSQLNGGPAKPTFATRMLHERGVNGRPTLMLNAETAAHLALIARRGAAWFRELGTEDHPGSTLVTLLGPVAAPGVYEIDPGCTIASLVGCAGGITEPVRAGLIGGYAGTWIDGTSLAGTLLARDHLARHGASLGAGVVALLPASACPVAQTARIARWMSGESAGQCGPCVHGLDAIADSLERVAQGVGLRERGRGIADLTALVRGRGACSHPDGVARLVDSALRAFQAELHDHARHGACAACAATSAFPLPAGDTLAARPAA